MTAPGFTVSAFILLLHVSFVANYPSGKVTKSCGGMIPEHGHTPQSHPAHNISVSQKTFRPGDQIKVTLSGPPFKGFLLEARDAENLSGPPVGSFTLIDSHVSQLLTCEDVQGSAVSHRSPSKKTEIKVFWDAPSGAPNHITFLATVVEKYKIYWVKIPGPVISQPNVPPFTTPEATIAPMPTVPSVSHLTRSFNASDCGNKKFCIRSPLNCDPEKERACVFLSFTRDDQSVMVEMSGPSKGYLSVAFSHDRWMRHVPPSHLPRGERKTAHSSLPGPGPQRLDSRETSGPGDLVPSLPEVGEGTCQLSPGCVLLRPPWESRVSLGTGARRSHGEALCHSHGGVGPAPAAAAPPFALHGARPSLSAASFCAWAACLSPLAFLLVSSPDS
ncbi:TPA: ferric-chelate reductase 1-like [Bos taurus]|nr:TPA: ferric-chelate reductase 1-like [Bos taurus]